MIAGADAFTTILPGLPVWGPRNTALCGWASLFIYLVHFNALSKQARSVAVVPVVQAPGHRVVATRNSNASTVGSLRGKAFGRPKWRLAASPACRCRS